MSDRLSRISLAIAFVICGLIVTSSGLFVLKHLGRVHRSADIAYVQAEQTFYDWLAGAVHQYGVQSNQLAGLIARRMLVMGVHDRRDAVNSMMIDVFWDELAPSGTDRTPIYSLMTRATAVALTSSPLSGDLWLFAAWLKTTISGFGEDAANYFLLSQRFTPREEALVLQRLDFITGFASSRSAEVEAAAIADLSVAQQIDPNRAQEYSKQLQQ